MGENNWCFTRSAAIKQYHFNAAIPVNRCHMKKKNSVLGTRVEPRKANLRCIGDRCQLLRHRTALTKGGVQTENVGKPSKTGPADCRPQ